MQDRRPIASPARRMLGLATGLLLVTSLTAQAMELPAPIEQLKQQGLTIHGTFDAPGGLQGYAASLRGRAIAAYLTPDGDHAVIGTLIDAQGQDVSAKPLERLVNGPKNARLWQQMAEHHWVRDGSADAKRVVYTLSDPNCPYCRKFWQEARPWVENGDVQLRHLMVGVLKADSAAKAATLLSAEDPSTAIGEHYRDGTMPNNRISDESRRWVSENTRLMRNARLNATPVIFYRDADGVHRVMGAPGPEKLREIMGGPVGD
ncbi:thiol:disulfide interchange protein DsbG [Modicisalibacter tunisiensis]|uniref:Thiol:disulfide interchange protein n=1 Tax=Modicisalibacter tunisiensis TaxID=390637 RepID=A0ABS7X2X5_9GAMM|nr:thiol:disulfide interchange protein DsbG [Modicisalibacter tunisiensis]KXS36702.1 MAG: hypothetical protein AWU55_2925 [Halomonadaceae bacterium T82-2]MBZ9569240.1 thiol:disulfide interchange protein DsbG [Modicisalibacter tunisiensis]